MKRKCIILAPPILMILLLSACYKDQPPRIIDLFPGFRQPAHFPAPAYAMASNPVTQAGFELGRKLFYEPALSRNNTISCGSCHIQSSAFTHHGHDISHGIDDRLGKRNSPPIMNLAWSKALMWDGGIFDLDLQPIAPITAHEEMDESVENVLQKLRSTVVYPPLFQKAFGSPEISTARFMKALSQFMLLCISSNSKYDSVSLGYASVYTPEEAAGYTLFKTKCGSCHQEPLFTDFSFRNNGIGIGYNNDEGRYPVTLNPEDRYKFKVPSLRNLRYTAPYMHDGRFYTLEAVLDHYSSEVKDMANLDPALKQGNSRGIPLSAVEKKQILAFLNTLNDQQFIHNKWLAEQ